MLFRFFGLAVFLVAHVNSQSYSQNSYNFSPQYGNHLHNQFSQGAGGSYPNQGQHSQQYSQPSSTQYTNHPAPTYSQDQGSGQNVQFGARYQSANVPASTPSSPAVAHGVVQHERPRAQPLPRVFTSSAPNTELAPLATASPTFPPPQPVLQPAPQQPQIQQQTFTNYPQTQGNFFYPPVPPQYNNEGQPQFQQPPQQPPTNVNPNYYNSYSNSTSQQQYREPPVVNYTFKEGTPPYYCAYGLPVPEYNTPRKKCIPWHPFCGIVFTCIMDV